jgi:hypothetical protein
VRCRLRRSTTSLRAREGASLAAALMQKLKFSAPLSRVSKVDGALSGATYRVNFSYMIVKHEVRVLHSPKYFPTGL